MELSKMARKAILARKEYIPGKPIEEVQRELGINNIIKLASNENPLGVSPKALEMMIEELKENAHRYPESLCYDLRQKLADIHGLSPEHFFIDNGEDGVITMLGLTFISPEDEVIFGEITFPAYENITTKMGGTCIRVSMTSDYRLDTKGFLSATSEKTKMIFICNPNNPTGTFTTRKEFERILFTTNSSTLIVSDEAYFEFVDDPNYPQTLSYINKYPNLIILRTFSKIMGLAGIRIGYAIAHPDIVKLMLKSREPFPVSRIAQAGALASLEDLEFVTKTLELNRQGRYQYYKAFERMKLTYYPTQTNFIMVDIGQPATPVFESMLRKGVIIRPLAPMGIPNALRITIGTKEENGRTIEVLKQALSK